MTLLSSLREHVETYSRSPLCTLLLAGLGEEHHIRQYLLVFPHPPDHDELIRGYCESVMIHGGGRSIICDDLPRITLKAIGEDGCGRLCRLLVQANPAVVVDT